MATNNAANSSSDEALDRDLSTMSKESTMSIRLETDRTNSTMDENVFDEAKRALAPSGITPKQFIGPDGVVRHMSPHMVNVHQFYPEINFSLDKGTVGEVVLSPKTSSGRVVTQKSSSKIDLKETIVEENGEEGGITKESTNTDFDNENSFYIEEKNARRGKITKTSVSTDDDDEDRELFQTQVDEKTIEAAKARQENGSELFYPEKWGPVHADTMTVEEITSEKAYDHAKTGEEFFKQERYDEAIICFSKAIILKPNGMEFYTMRGECFLRLTDFQSAILNYKKACVMDPDNTQYYNRLAFIYYFNGQCLFDQKLFPEALESFSRSSEMRPDVMGYHMRSIACLAALQRHGECLALVNKRLDSESSNPDLYVMRAILHQLFRNTTLCYYDIKDALAIDPTHDQANKVMASLEQKALEFRQQSTNMSLSGRFRDALQKIAIAIETNPSVAEFHNVRGAAHRKLGDFNAAIDDYLLALDKTDHNEDDPVYLEAQRQLLLTYNDFAVECFTKGFYEEAIILLNKAIKGEKGEKGLYVNRGDCFFKEGNLEFALADYNQGIELDPHCKVIRKRIAMVHNEYGVQEYLEKHNKEAESRFTLAVNNDPTNAKYYVSRARTRHLLENLYGARQDVLMAIHLEPGNPEIPSLMVRFFHGKSTKEVLASQMAVTVRKQLQGIIVSPPSPVKLDPISTQASRSTTRTGLLAQSLNGSGRTTSELDDNDSILDLAEDQPIPPIPGRNWQRSFPSIKSCMADKEFNISVAKEKRQMNSKIKDSLVNRKSLSAIGATKISAMPDSEYLKTKVNKIGKEKLAIKQPASTTGWRNFGLGISGGGSM